MNGSGGVLCGDGTFSTFGMGKTSIPKVSRFGTKLEHGASNWCPSPFRPAWFGWFANCNEDTIGCKVLVFYFAVHCRPFQYGWIMAEVLGFGNHPLE